MRHLPNLLTLANLFCGGLATVCALHAQPYLFHNTGGNPTYEWEWDWGATQLHYAGILILAASLFDMLDGMAARALGVHSPIGKDLDSLADVVSFGVAPSAILYQMLWDRGWSGVGIVHSLVQDVPMMAMAPAFLVACFAALRLARFNVSTPPTAPGTFTGVPTPAIGLVVAGLALSNWDTSGIVSRYFENSWTIYLLIAALCWLMVCRLRFLKLAPPNKSMAQIWPRAVLVLGAAGLLAWLRFEATLPIFALYIVLSFFVPKAASKEVPA